MKSGIATGLLVLALCVGSCGLDATPAPATRTPRPTITATSTAEATALAATASLAPLVTDTPAPAIDTPLPASPEAGASPTAGPRPTSTRRPFVFQPTALQPLTITNILLVLVERDPTRDNGAIASLQIVYSGGRGPYTIFHDDTLQPENPFKVLTVCHGTLLHTVRLVSGDNQVVTKQYYLWPVDCPP